MNRWMTLVLLAASMLVVACEEQKPAAQSTGSQAEATPKPAVAVAPIKDEDIPTPSDFDEEAAKDISADNYKAEVDALDKEISAE